MVDPDISTLVNFVDYIWFLSWLGNLWLLLLFIGWNDNEDPVSDVVCVVKAVLALFLFLSLVLL